jgi:hypothetical protein
MSKILIRNNQQGDLMKTFTETLTAVFFSKKTTNLITVLSFIFGICLMRFTDLSKYMLLVIAVIVYLGLGQMFLQHQNQGKIPRKLKGVNILGEAICLGISLGGVIFAPDICAKILSLIIFLLIIPVFISFSFTVETSGS